MIETYLVTTDRPVNARTSSSTRVVGGGASTSSSTRVVGGGASTSDEPALGYDPGASAGATTVNPTAANAPGIS